MTFLEPGGKERDFVRCNIYCVMLEHRLTFNMSEHGPIYTLHSKTAGSVKLRSLNMQCIFPSSAMRAGAVRLELIGK